MCFPLKIFVHLEFLNLLLILYQQHMHLHSYLFLQHDLNHLSRKLLILTQNQISQTLHQISKTPNQVIYSLNQISQTQNQISQTLHQICQISLKIKSSNLNLVQLKFPLHNYLLICQPRILKQNNQNKKATFLRIDRKNKKK